jgi:vacuolar iron transporter family protein
MPAFKGIFMKAPLKKHREGHKSERVGWLRAAVLGANDGIVSTASLIVGIATAHSTHQQILISGVAGLVAGAMSMAAGEYVSVSSQADTERADLDREKKELATNLDFEREELAQIYMERGLDAALARQVAYQLMEHDALGSHARDELGITDFSIARPVQAALMSAASFSLGAALPLLMVLIAPVESVVLSVSATALVFLLALGILAARVGGANIWLGAFRVGFWGALAMSATAAIGMLFNVTVT